MREAQESYSVRLATFVHISDLHFGDIDPNTGGVTYDARAPRTWANFKHFDGLLGHSYRALQRLEKFFSDIRQREDAQLIVTGDLTSTGSQEQFNTANDYMGSMLRPPKGNYIGLFVPAWKNRAIPGNHDHWPGSVRILGAPVALAFNLPTLPLLEPYSVTLLTGQPLPITFVKINTDADVNPYSRNRALARGSFCSQLAAASRMLGLPKRDEIRVLLLHHSRAHQGRTLRMDTASRQALDPFLVEQDVAVVLSGHTHDPHVQPFSVTHHGKTIEALEARCGTTLQTDTFPYYWKNILGRRPSRQLPRNTLLVHRLLEENNEVIWHAQTYNRTPYGFDKSPSGPEYRLKVWPRP